jgi:hypothetical protein
MFKIETENAMEGKRLLSTGVRSGVPFGVAMSLFFSLSYGLPAGLVAGAVAGLLFGVALALFTEAQRKKLEVTGDYQGESILHQGPANHWRRGEARGGWLLLTPRRLVFRAHQANVQNEPIELAVADVRSCEPCRTLGVVPNGLRVYLGSGAQERFVVSERASWVAKLIVVMVSVGVVLFLVKSV